MYQQVRIFLAAILTLSVLSLTACVTPQGAGSQAPIKVTEKDVPNFDPLRPNQKTQSDAATPLNKTSIVEGQGDAEDNNPMAALEDWAADNQAPANVAILLPLTGPSAPMGQALLNAAQLALFDLKSNSVNLMPFDTAGTETGALQAAQKAVSQKAQIILGPLFATEVRAISNYTYQQNVPVVTFSTDWTVAGRNIYAMGFLPFSQVARVVDYAAQKNRANFAALVPQNPYGVAISGTLKKELTNQALVAPYVVNINGGVEGMRQAVQNFVLNKDAKTDTLMLALGGSQLSEAATLLRQNDVNLTQIKLIGTGLWDDAQSINTGLLQGGWYAAPDPSLRTDFETRYKQNFGTPAPRLASLGYDATALATVLASSNNALNPLDNPFSRSALLNSSGFAGIDGIFRFRPDGLIDRGLAVLEVTARGPVVIDPAPKRF